jgi:hypothetical protein
MRHITRLLRQAHHDLFNKHKFMVLPGSYVMPNEFSAVVALRNIGIRWGVFYKEQCFCGKKRFIRQQ